MCIRDSLTIEDRVYRKRAKKWWYPKEFYPLRFYFQNEIPLLTTVIEDGKEYLYSVCSAKVQIIEKPGDSKAGFRLLTIGEIRASAKEEQWKKWLDGNRYTLIENGKRILTKENRFEESYKLTIGTDISAKLMQVEDKNIYLIIWDIGGQERYQILT
mgnify:CR=1 FL=1